MSEIAIKDGTGKSYEAKVDSENRLYTKSFTIDHVTHANQDRRAYNISTGDITLTNATETPVLYIKNNETKNLHIESMVLWTGTSTDGTATLGVKWVVVRNPTAGTIVSNATAVDIESSRNFGSNDTLLLDSYKGATGNTMTGGTDHILIRDTLFGRKSIPVNEIISKGTSIGFNVTPPTGNTSLIVYVAVVCFLEE